MSAPCDRELPLLKGLVQPAPQCPTGRKVGRHLLLPALCPHGRQAHGGHPRGQESQENGRGRAVW